MKKFALLFCLVLYTCRLSAQKINIDSLIHVATIHSQNYAGGQNENSDSLFKLLPQANSSHSRINLIYKIINNGQGLSKSGLNNHYRILSWAKKNKDHVTEAIISAELGFQSGINGDIAEGIKMGLNALQLAKNTNNNEAIGIAYDALACSYGLDTAGGNSSGISLCIKYFKQGLKYSQLGHNDLFITYDYGGAGVMYNEAHQTDSATFYTLKSFEYAVNKNISIQAARSLLDFAVEQSDEKLKLKYFRASAAIAKQGSIAFVMSLAYLGEGRFYKDHGNIDSAIFYARKAYNLVNKEAIGEIMGPALLLNQLYNTRNADSALKYTNIYHVAKDSMFSISKAVRAQAVTYADQQRQQEIETQKEADQTRLRYYMLLVAIVFFLLLAIVFWRNNQKSKKANTLLKKQKEEIDARVKEVQIALRKLQETQQQLIQAEKMASLGELTAGIAHEIQNPLNFVNNFSEVNQEMIGELEDELKAGNIDEVLAIAADLKQNEEKINYHGKRADSIVKGMLEHSRTSSGQKEPADINVLADEYLRLAYHGLRAKDKSFNAELITNFDVSLPKINIIGQDIGRVLLNLFNNAFYATQQKQKTAGVGYKPRVAVSTSVEDGSLILKISDNGIGIPDAIKDKILQPFFTTKPTGEGTGLGLSLSYDIVVKGHGGQLYLDTIQGYSTVFTIKLPI